MDGNDQEKIIATARRAFDVQLHDAEFQAVLADDAQLPWLIEGLDPRPGGRYLDLATGDGYVGLALAANKPDSQVTGVDIAGAAIATNTKKALAAGLDNIHFEAVDGIGLRFGDGHFDGVVCRYALHHFPALATTLAEVHRVLKQDGRLVVADAIRDDADDVDFVNRFQALQPDGHVRMYGREELLQTCTAQGFELEGSQLTEITFPRALDAGNSALLAETPPEILALYDVKVAGQTISARLSVVCARFRRCDRPA
jgi:SAM-dependent methyltransferase